MFKKVLAPKLGVLYLCSRYVMHMFQPPSSSQWEVCNKSSNILEILGFRLFESLKNALSVTFCSPKLSLESLMLHCLCEHLAEYSPDIKIRTSVIVYLILQHFLLFKNYRLNWFSNFPQHLFCWCQNIKCFCWHGSTAHDEYGGKEQGMHLIVLLVAKIFTSSL